MRREQIFSEVNIRTNRKTWKKTRDLLQSLILRDLELAAIQENNHQPITNEAVKELLRLLDQIGMGASGSDQKKLHMLIEYTIVPYLGHKEYKDDPGYAAGCILELLSVAFFELSRFRRRRMRL